MRASVRGYDGAMSRLRPALACAAALSLAAGDARASFINYLSREINCKVVYYGPTTASLRDNVRYVYDKTAPEAKGKMIELSTETGKVLFFDFSPPTLGAIRGFKVRFHLYTTTRGKPPAALLLKGVDGVVFVADGDPAQLAATRASWAALKADLRALGYDWKKTPLVIQLDHRELPNALSLEALKSALRLHQEQLYEAASQRGVGVFDTLKAVATRILTLLKTDTEKQPP